MKTPVGLQLYSVRDSMKEDFEGTLKKVSALGYTAVEFAGFFDRTPEQVNGLLKKYGLSLWGTHCGLQDLLTDYQATVDYHKAIGNRYYIIPAHDLKTQEKLDRFIDQVNPLCRSLAREGITLAYHNHDWEFEKTGDGSTVFDQLVARTDLKFEVDTYWAFIGMQDPIGLMEQLKDRLIFAHIKDGTVAKEDKPLGMGETPVAQIVAYAREKGVPMIVESESCNPSGLAEAQICIRYLKPLL